MKKLLLCFPIILYVIISCKEIKDKVTEVKLIKKSINNGIKEVQLNRFIELNLINTISKKEVSNFTIENILNTFGNPLSIEKENKTDPKDGAEPWTRIKYEGLIIEFIGNAVSDITINSKQRKINNIEIGKTNADIEKVFKKIERKFNNYSLFEIPELDGVTFSEANEKGKIIEFGISLSS